MRENTYYLCSHLFISMAMKVLFFLLLSVLGFVCNAQEEYVIKGHVPHIADGARIKLVEWYDSIGETLATDTIRNGKFEFKGKVENIPAKMEIGVEGDSAFYGNCTFWIGGGVTEVEGNDYCLPLWRVKNKMAEQQEESRFIQHASSEIRNFEHFFYLNQEAYNAEFSDRHKKQPEMKDYPVRRKVDSLSVLKMRADLELLRECRAISKVGIEKLYRMAIKLKYSETPGISREEVEQVYLRLDSVQKNSARGNEIHTYLYPQKIAEIGEKFVDGVLYDLEGKPHQLGDYKGKYMLLDFWSCGCGPCVMAQPELEEVAEIHRDSLYVISINLDNSEKLWRKASEKIKGINLSDRLGQGGLVARYGFEGMPMFVIVGPDGKIRNKITGYGKGLLKLMLEKCWKENGDGNKND